MSRSEKRQKFVYFKIFFLIVVAAFEFFLIFFAIQIVQPIAVIKEKIQIQSFKKEIRSALKPLNFEVVDIRASTGGLGRNSNGCDLLIAVLVKSVKLSKDFKILWVPSEDIALPKKINAYKLGRDYKIYSIKNALLYDNEQVIDSRTILKGGDGEMRMNQTIFIDFFQNILRKNYQQLPSYYDYSHFLFLFFFTSPVVNSCR